MNKKEIIDILIEKKCPEYVIKHSELVCERAIEISEQLGDEHSIDLNLIKTAALLHDIGRSKTQGINHAIVGGEIVKNLGFEEKIVNAVERHIGAGITKEEAEKLGLIPKDYLPETLEEKIVAHADNLTNGDRAVSLEFTIEKWERKMGKDHPSIKRIKKLHKSLILE